MPRKPLMGPYRVDNLVLREEPEIESRIRRLNSGSVKLNFWRRNDNLGLLANDFFNFWRQLVKKRAETPVESISDAERKSMKTLKHFPTFFWSLTVNIYQGFVL